MTRFFTLFFLWSAIAYANHSLPALPDMAPVFVETNQILTPNSGAGLLADTIPPTISCPPNDTFQLASGLCDSIYLYTVTAMDSQMVLMPSQLTGLPSGDMFPIGTTINTFMAMDTAGNSATCSFSVVVEPATAAMDCRTDTVHLFLDMGCMAVLDPASALLAPFGCVQGFEIEYDTAAPFGDGPWAAAVFGDAHRDELLGYRVTNLATGDRCFGYVDIRDTLPPTLDCPAVNVPCSIPTAHLSPEFLNDSLGIAAGMPVLTENCLGNISFGHIDINVDVPCDSPGNVTNIIRRFWTVLDGSNNVATCVQHINRIRALDDVLFPDDITVSCSMDTLPETTGAPYVQIGNYQYSLLSAPFCEIAATFSDSIETICGGSLRLHRSWTVRDACLSDTVVNSVTGMQIIDFEDDLQPTVHCPTDTIIQYSLSNCQDTINLPDLLVSDACSYVTEVLAYWNIDGQPDTLKATLSDFPGNNPAVSDTLAVFGLAPNFPVGTTDIRYLATDACGNTSSCEMQLIVWDSVPPTAVCDSFQLAYLDELGLASLPAGIADNGSSDGCTGVSFKIKRQTPGTCDNLGNALNDLLNFCCDDLDDTIQVILRVYDVPVPPGPVSDNFATGQFSDCSLPVVILDTNDPQCEAPADTTVLCENFDPTLASYGVAQNTCRADSTVVLLDMQLFDTLCNQGQIIRTFQVFDKTGQSGQCSQKITVENQQHYFVRFPDDLYINMCDTAGQYGEPELFGIDCEKISIDYMDTIITVVPDACFKIERTWTIINWCTFDPNLPYVQIPNPEPNALPIHSANLPGPVVSEAGTMGVWAPTKVQLTANAPDSTDFSMFWSANVNGYKYTQQIKIIDIEPPQFEDCDGSTTVFVDSTINDFFLWNGNYSPEPNNPKQDLCEGAADLQITMTDACFGADLGVDYVLFLDVDGDDVQETEVNSNDLPSAGHVQYDNINNANFPNGITKQFDHRPVVSADKYQFALQTSTNGRYRTVRLVWQTENEPGTYYTPQLPLGNHSIRWLVYDGCGNENTCTMNFRVEDPDGTCTPAEVVVVGSIETEANVGVANVAVQLDGTHSSLPAFNLFDLSDQQGQFDFSVPTSASYSVTPYKNDDPLNGVSTFDLLLVNKHILGLAALDSPYKLIAADANKSNSVTTFDIVQLRKLILGLYQELPGNTSWRFIPVGHAFPDPANPFQGGFPELQIVTNLQQNNLPMHHFVGVKVGDVNGNASPDITSEILDDRNGETLFFDLENQVLEAGTLVQVPVRTAVPIAGFQMTLNYPGLELLDLTGLATENFAVFNAQNSMTASWNDGGQVAFTLHFRVLQKCRLSEQLQISNRITRSEAYSSALEMMPIALRFSDNVVTTAGFELYQNQPNPFNGTTEIGFYLPEAKTTTLRVWDAQGRLLLEQSAFYAAGKQSIMLEGPVLDAGAGLLYYELKTDTDRAIRKMVLAR